MIELNFVISPETHELVGEVTIAYVDETGKNGFVLTPARPLNEWAGFGVYDIKV